LKSGPYGGRFAFDTFVAETYPWDSPCLKTGCQLSMGHDHADANTFNLYSGGAWLIAEEARYADHDTSSHNTILIDGDGQYWPRRTERRQPEVFAGLESRLVETASTPGFDFVVSDATGAYRDTPDLQTFTRHVLFVRPDYLIMLDNLAASEAHTYEWVGHFTVPVDLEDGWFRGSGANGQAIGVRTLSPQPNEVNRGDDGLPYIRIRPAGRLAATRFINILYPTTTESWSSRPGVDLLADSGGVAVVRVQFGDGSERVDEIVLNYDGAGLDAGGDRFRFDGDVAVVRRLTGEKPTRLFLSGGTRLEDVARGQRLLTSTESNSALEVRYEGDTVEILGAFSGELTLFAPGVEVLLVNGQARNFLRQGDYIIAGNR
jgi:hypothetical protein